jgi:hypothetical protein
VGKEITHAFSRRFEDSEAIVIIHRMVGGFGGWPIGENIG